MATEDQTPTTPDAPKPALGGSRVDRTTETGPGSCTG